MKRIVLSMTTAAGLMFGAGAVQAQDMAAQMTQGADLYTRNCQGCHGANGEGGMGFRLDGNPVMAASSGVAGMIINGYLEHGMPPFGHLSNDEIASIVTYVRNSWSNAFGGPTDPAMVEGQRAAGGGE